MQQTYTAFNGHTQLTSGSLHTITTAVRQCLKQDTSAQILVFNDTTGQQTDIELHDDIEQTPLQPSKNDKKIKSKPGRPALGVIAREITLLPRHWEWLSIQPNGASATLRRLVETASKTENKQAQIRQIQAALDKFMMVMAGNLPHYEEASRATYAGDYQRLRKLSIGWPSDIHGYVLNKIIKLEELSQIGEQDE